MFVHLSNCWLTLWNNTFYTQRTEKCLSHDKLWKKSLRKIHFQTFKNHYQLTKWVRYRPDIQINFSKHFSWHLNPWNCFLYKWSFQNISQNGFKTMKNVSISNLWKDDFTKTTRKKKFSLKSFTILKSVKPNL